MATAMKSDPASGQILRSIAIASAVVYSVFALVLTLGGSETSYQTPLWGSWVVVILAAGGTFAIGAAMHRGTKASAAGAADHAPALTSVS